MSFTIEKKQCFVWGPHSQYVKDIPSNLDINNIKKIVSGEGRCIALMNNNTLVEWGYLQSKFASTLSNVKDVAITLDNSFALLNNGTVVWWGNTTDNLLAAYVEDIKKLTNIKAIALGKTHMVCLTNEGKLIGFGKIITTYPALATPIPTIPITRSVIDGLLPVNNVSTSARSLELPQIIVNMTFPDNLPKFNDISITCTGVVGIKDDTTIMVLGDTNTTIRLDEKDYINYGMNEIPPNLHVLSVASGDGYIVALTLDKTVVGWGYNMKVPKDLTNVKAIVSGDTFVIALKEDGTLVIWETSIYSHSPPSSLHYEVTSISACKTHIIAIANVPETDTSKRNLLIVLGSAIFIILIIIIILLILYNKRLLMFKNIKN